MTMDKRDSFLAYSTCHTRLQFIRITEKSVPHFLVKQLSLFLFPSLGQHSHMANLEVQRNAAGSLTASTSATNACTWL